MEFNWIAFGIGFVVGSVIVGLLMWLTEPEGARFDGE